MFGLLTAYEDYDDPSCIPNDPDKNQRYDSSNPKIGSFLIHRRHRMLLQFNRVLRRIPSNDGPLL